MNVRVASRRNHPNLSRGNARKDGPDGAQSCARAAAWDAVRELIVIREECRWIEETKAD